MFAIAYVSTATRQPTREDLEHLLRDSREFNASMGVTGVLLLQDMTFFQYLEGPRPAAGEVYERIKRSRLHRNLSELLHEPTPMRYFRGWYMGFSEPPPGFILDLSNGMWHHNVPRDHPDLPTGVRLLLDFWHRTQRRITR